jgi:hypothetical protein
VLANPIRISEHSGKWIVRVTDAGVTSERRFDFELHAMSWASEQIIRLGIPFFLDDEPQQDLENRPLRASR